MFTDKNNSQSAGNFYSRALIDLEKIPSSLRLGLSSDVQVGLNLISSQDNQGQQSQPVNVAASSEVDVAVNNQVDVAPTSKVDVAACDQVDVAPTSNTDDTSRTHSAME